MRLFSAILRSGMLLSAALALTACDTVGGWFESDESTLSGERISVLALSRELTADASTQNLAVKLPAARVNPEWRQTGGSASAAMQHLALPAAVTEIWRTGIGHSADNDERIVARPVATAGIIAVMDSRAMVSAIDRATGRTLWRTNLVIGNEEPGEIGGGLAFGERVLVGTTPYGGVVALNPQNGEIFWRTTIQSPIRGAPLVANKRVYVLGPESRMVALDMGNGEILWEHQGLPEATELVGSASPTTSGPFVLAPYASGEIYALRADTGQSIWSDQLVRARQGSPLGSINDVDGLPVIDGERVYVISHGGFMAAINLTQGNRIWDKELAGRETPWIAGDFLYVITVESELLAISTGDGGIRWVIQLPKFTGSDNDGDRITWTGPVLGGGRLFVASDQGALWEVSPLDGSVLNRRSLGAGVTVAPIIVDNVLYVLTGGADLIAFR